MAETPWLHGTIPKEDANGLLQGQPDGTFLIRKRVGADDHILSVNYRGMTTHHLLTKNDGGHFTVNKQDYGTKASTLPELVSKLRGKVKKWPVPLQEGIAASAADPVIDAVQDFPYYHGLITEAAADDLLAEDPVDGVYLFRQLNPSNKHEYMLSVMYQGEPTHYHAKLQSGTFFINETCLPNCTSLQQIVEELSNAQSVLPVALLRGIAPKLQQSAAALRVAAVNSADQDTWYHGYITKDIAEDRLRGIGLQDGHFLVRARSDAADNNCFIISVVFRGAPTHHLVEPGDGLYKVNGSTQPAASVSELVLLFREAQKSWPVPLTRHAPGLSTLPAELSKPLPDADAPEAAHMAGVASAPEPPGEGNESEGSSAAHEEDVQGTEPAAEAAGEQQESGGSTASHVMDVKEEGSATAADKPVKNDITPLDQEGEVPDEGLVKKIREGLLRPAEVDAEIDRIKPRLPYPDLDMNEETVEPWLTMHYHGAIGTDKAKEILRKKNVDGNFLLRDLAPSGSGPKATHCSLMLSLLHDDKVHHVKLTQQDEHGVIFFDDKATGERTLSQAITYLSQRQAGWGTPLSEGVLGIKVMSQAEKKRQHEANQAAVKEAEARKQALRDENLRAQARERGEKTRQKQREEIAHMQSEEERFKHERQMIRQEQIERRREQLRQQMIEDRKKKALEEKRRRRLEAARRGNNTEPVIELSLTSDEEDSDDEEEVKEWRRRASAQDYGFNTQTQRPGRAQGVEGIPEEESEEVSGFGGRSHSSRRRSSRRSSRHSQGDGTDPEKCSLM